MTAIHPYTERVVQLRKQMEQEGLDAYLLPTSDAFQSEYLPPESRHMQWLSGFSGENGVVVVTRKKAAVFVDGRFTVQITKQAPAEIFEYQHIEQTPPIEWLTANLPGSSHVGFYSYLHSAGWETRTRNRLAEHGIELIDLKDNLVNRIWQDRPADSKNPVILLETAGQSSLEKRQELGEQLKKSRSHSLLISHPECTNWLLNIRGRDIPCTPVIMSYGLLHTDGSMDFFVDTDKLTEGFSQHVGNDVAVYNFNHIDEILGDLCGSTVHIDAEGTPARLYSLIKQSGAILKEGKDPTFLAKARKNKVELEGMRRAHIRDGVAMCRFLHWLDNEVAAGTTHDEGTLADKVEALREEQDLYLEPSFETISSLGPNAAMCHYNHKNGTPRKIGQDGVYLLDSGGQYLDGTTDITRTIKVGDVSDEFRKMCTLTLTGHIALATTHFPANKVSGLQLDAITRMALWKEGFDYDHGTGHGVGHCLGVHESPANITTKVKNDPLEAGFVVSIEPGYYRADHWGIRHENLYEVVPCNKTGDIDTLTFRTITFAPIDTRLLDINLMTETEITWLNDYHQQVIKIISSSLSEEEQIWLEQSCRAI